MKSKTVLMPLIIVSGLAGLATTGFASWSLYSRIVKESEMNISADADVQFLSWLELNRVESDKCQKYFYLDSESQTRMVGGLVYHFELDPLKLEPELQRENANGGYTFSVVGAVSSSEPLFSRTANNYLYFDSIKLDDSIVSNTYVSDYSTSFIATFSTTSKTKKTTSSLSFLFTNRLLIAFSNALTSGITFHLSFTGVAQ